MNILFHRNKANRNEWVEKMGYQLKKAKGFDRLLAGNCF